MPIRKLGETLQSGKYKIVRILGQGGFGITYLAQHTMLGTYVAIKQFYPKSLTSELPEEATATYTASSSELFQRYRRKFVKEAQTMGRISHPGIVKIHDIFEEDNDAFFVMDYIEGPTLSQMISERGPLDEQTATGYILKVAEALGHLHAQKVNHLDIKPSNIIVRRSDNSPILIDFGLAKQYDGDGNQTSTTPVGISHGYAPIEQYNDKGIATFSAETDIYSLGATLYKLVSGVTPPEPSGIIENGLPPVAQKISDRMRRAIAHAMSIRRNDRPHSIDEFMTELSSVKPSKPSEPSKPKTSGWAWVIIIAVLCAVGGATAYFMLKDDDTPSRYYNDDDDDDTGYDTYNQDDQTAMTISNNHAVITDIINQFKDAKADGSLNYLMYQTYSYLKQNVTDDLWEKETQYTYYYAYLGPLYVDEDGSYYNLDTKAYADHPEGWSVVLRGSDAQTPENLHITGFYTLTDGDTLRDVIVGMTGMTSYDNEAGDVLSVHYYRYGSLYVKIRYHSSGDDGYFFSIDVGDYSMITATSDENYWPD